MEFFKYIQKEKSPFYKLLTLMEQWYTPQNQMGIWRTLTYVFKQMVFMFSGFSHLKTQVILGLLKTKNYLLIISK